MKKTTFQDVEGFMWTVIVISTIILIVKHLINL